MTKLERVIGDPDYAVDLYLSEVEAEEFKKDVCELITAMQDNGIIDRAIELLQSCRGE